MNQLDDAHIASGSRQRRGRRGIGQVRFGTILVVVPAVVHSHPARVAQAPSLSNASAQRSCAAWRRLRPSTDSPGRGRVVDVPRLPPPALALGAAVAQRRLSGARPRPGRGRAAVAVAASLASVSMAGAAALRFRSSGTTLEPFHPERATALVTSGAYTISRNPMYVGLAGLLTAHAVWRGSGPPSSRWPASSSSSTAHRSGRKRRRCSRSSGPPTAPTARRRRDGSTAGPSTSRRRGPAGPRPLSIRPSRRSARASTSRRSSC